MRFRLLPSLLMVTSLACGRVGFEGQASVDGSSNGSPDGASGRLDGATSIDGASPADATMDSGQPNDTGTAPADSGALVDSGVTPGDVGVPDAGPVATGPFGPAVRLDALSDPGEDDDDVTLTGDLLEIYFTSTRPGGTGGEDIWTSRRASAGDAWPPPTPVSAFNTDADDLTAGISTAGLTIWFASWRPGDGESDIYTSSRPDRDSPWSAPTLVSALSGPDLEVYPRPNRAQTSILFSSNRAGSMDIYEATRSSVSMPWAAPVPVAELNTGFVDTSPFLSHDGLRAYFDSDRPGSASRDLYVASRSTIGSPFSAPSLLSSVNTANIDSDPWLSPDESTLVFASNRDTGTYDLYVATRPPP